MAGARLDARVPGLIAEAAEDEEALGALRAVLGVLQAGAAASWAEDTVCHALQPLRQLQILPPRQLLLCQQASQALHKCRAIIEKVQSSLHTEAPHITSRHCCLGSLMERHM